VPVHADFIGDGDLWRTCGGYLRSPSPQPPLPAVTRDNVALLRGQSLDDDERQSSDECFDVFYNHHHQHHQQQQLIQQQRAPSPIDDISDEPMFSFTARAQSKAYKYAIVGAASSILNLLITNQSINQSVNQSINQSIDNLLRRPHPSFRSASRWYKVR